MTHMSASKGETHDKETNALKTSKHYKWNNELEGICQVVDMPIL
jgi:hypothetical protein